MTFRFLLPSSLFLTLLAMPPALAQTGPQPLPPLSVNASPAVTAAETQARAGSVPQESSSTARSTVTATTLDQRQARRLEDVLRDIPGVTLGPQRGAGLERAVSLRGIGARGVRVFVDGMEMSDTSQAQSQYKLTEINLRDIESVDVLRGPQTGRYGADTGGGVIVITTRRPTAPLAGQAGLEAGSYKTKRAFANASGLQGPVDWRLSVSGADIGGYSDFKGGEKDDPFHQWGLNATVGVQASDTLHLQAVARYQRRDVFYDASTQDRDWDRDETEQALRLGGTHSALSGALISQFGIADTLTTRQYWGFGTKGDTYDGGKTRLDYTGTYALTDTVSLAFGGDATRERIEQRTPGFAPTAGPLDAHFWKKGAFTTLGVTPLENLNLSATVRGDTHDDFGGKGTWRLGSAYTIATTGTTLRGSYGTSWQTPSLYERFDPCYGRDSLRPETAKGWDIGLDQSLLNNRVKSGVSLFRTTTEDEIAFQGGAALRAGCNGGGYVNLNRTKVKGVEWESALQLTDTLRATASYTWMQADNALTGTRLRDRPLHQAGGGLDWQLRKDVSVGTSLHYRDNTTNSWTGRADEFWTADLRAAWDVTEAVNLHLRIENLFNARYEEDPGYGTPGRSGYAGVTVSF